MGKELKIIGVVENVQDKPFFMSARQHALYFPSLSGTGSRITT